MRTGLYISGAAHGGLILWLLVGGTIFRAKPPEPPTTTEVSLISAAEFDAMVSSAPEAPIDTQSPPEAPGAPQESAPPASRPADAAPVAPAPRPEAVAEAAPEAAPPEPPAPPARPAEVADAPPDAPDAPERDPVGATLVAPPKAGAAPRPAQRIAPTPAAPPPPGAREDPLRQAATQPDTQPTVEQPLEQQEATAPKEAAAQTVTEADATSEETVVAAAPERSDRPKARPDRPRPAPQKTVKVEPPTPPAPAEKPKPEKPKPEPPKPAAQVAEQAPADAAVEAAIAAAMGAVGDSRNSAKTPDPTLPVGPPLTAGEKDGLRFAVSQCWNLGSSSTEARRTEVTVAVTMDETGRPVANSIRMLGFQGGTEDGARVAFDAARRAILRCGAKGFDLPPEKYAQWREVEMTFNPDSMRIR